MPKKIRPEANNTGIAAEKTSRTAMTRSRTQERPSCTR